MSLLFPLFIMTAHASGPAFCTCTDVAADVPGYGLIMSDEQGVRIDRFFEATEFDQHGPTQRGMEEAKSQCQQYKITLIQSGACRPN